MSTPLLSCQALAVAIGGRPLCRDLSFEVRARQCWAILGRNGAGKTTLLNTLAGLREPADGTIRLGGEPLSQHSRRTLARARGVVPQDHIDPFPATVFDTAMIGRHPHLGRWQWESSRDIEVVSAALASVGLTGFEARDVQTLSGGERQRLAIATLCAQDPTLLFLDEPSHHLDLHQQIATLEILHALAKERDKALVMVLHDINLAARYCDQVILLGGGRAEVGGSEVMLTADRLSALFGHSLSRYDGATHPVFVPR